MSHVRDLKRENITHREKLNMRSLNVKIEHCVSISDCYSNMAFIRQMRTTYMLKYARQWFFVGKCARFMISNKIVSSFSRQKFSKTNIPGNF